MSNTSKKSIAQISKILHILGRLKAVQDLGLEDQGLEGEAVEGLRALKTGQFGAYKVTRAWDNRGGDDNGFSVWISQNRKVLADLHVTKDHYWCPWEKKVMTCTSGVSFSKTHAPRRVRRGVVWAAAEGREAQDLREELGALTLAERVELVWGGSRTLSGGWVVEAGAYGPRLVKEAPDGGRFMTRGATRALRAVTPNWAWGEEEADDFLREEAIREAWETAAAAARIPRGWL